MFLNDSFEVSDLGGTVLQEGVLLLNLIPGTIWTAISSSYLGEKTVIHANLLFIKVS